ncbi:hypothetical protein H0H92_008295 [Tricholoma furcatifolium]|nr:hypothetical protein H0H92_008295 [Tricholoma furcatifolium]
MSPDERELLQGIGSDLLLKFYVGIGPMLLYGLLCPVTLLSTVWDLASEHRKSWKVKATLFVVAFSLLAATGYLITLLYIPHVIPRAVMIYDDDLSLENRATLSDNLVSQWSNAQIIIQQLPLLTNDGLIIWRAWALLAKRRWVLGLLLITCKTATAGWSPIFLSTKYTLMGTSMDAGTLLVYYVAQLEGADYVFSISNANALLTIATNALATCFIAYVLWYELRDTC